MVVRGAASGATAAAEVSVVEDIAGAWKERAGAMIFGMLSSLGIYTLPNSLQTLRAKKELKRTFFFDNLCSLLKPKFRAQSSS